MPMIIPATGERLPCRLALLLILLMLAGCATAPQTRALFQDAPAGLPARAELMRVPFFPQEDYYCGPAALATLLVDRGLPVTAEQLVPEVYLPQRAGSLQAELLAAARARGLVADELSPELEDLLREVAAGNPVLVLQNLGLRGVPRWHYAVVVGYDLPQRRIILRSGPHQRHVNDFARFERTWQRAGGWAVVTVKPDQPPASAAPLPWLHAAHALEATGQAEAAARAYAAATQRWPEQPAGWFGLGNTRHVLGDHEAAEAALRELLRRQPGLHMAWNNLAHVLAARGCGAQARAAADCALRLAPEEPRYRNTREQLLEVGPGTACKPVKCPH